MAVFEKSTLLQCKDAAGNVYLLYPITTLDCVDGAEDLLHFGEQVLAEAEKAQARANIGAAPAPATAAVGQFLRVAAVDANGRVTAVEAVSMTDGSGSSGGSVSVDGETLILKNATVDGEKLIIS